jgi:hypothetical protein
LEIIALVLQGSERELMSDIAVVLQSAHMKDVSTFQTSTLAISAEVFRKNRRLLNPFAGRENALHLTVGNEGEKSIKNAIIEVLTSENMQIADPGVTIGTHRRHIRLPELNPGKSVKYKLAIKPHKSMTSGFLTFEVKDANWKTGNETFSTRLGLTRLD